MTPDASSASHSPVQRVSAPIRSTNDGGLGLSGLESAGSIVVLILLIPLLPKPVPWSISGAHAFIALWSLSQCSIVFRVSPGLQSARRLFHRARRIPPDADSTRRASGSWACRLNAPHEHPVAFVPALVGTLRTRPPPTPSFALHTATPAPPHALLSRFPALIAPSSVRQRSGTRRPALPTLEQHHLVVQYLHDTGVRAKHCAGPHVASAEHRCVICARERVVFTLPAPSPAPPLFPVYARHTPRRWSSIVCAHSRSASSWAYAPSPHVHRRPEPIAQGRATYGLVKIRSVIFFVHGRAAASVLARVRISDTRRAPAAVDERGARTARGGGRSGQRRAYLA
ncbi:hypothetical protein B0H17DRAFT_1215179 [Mycena rosella]|uniref:Uncharacterized protein n=1 Tax=Mycena rosella TaxID=1033263 RepID=A0AAD7CL87_MYCRO|nr:hypothetical protein B0H17DRAFT_1215179 [Mycena rosella]